MQISHPRLKAETPHNVESVKPILTRLQALNSNYIERHSVSARQKNAPKVDEVYLWREYK